MDKDEIARLAMKLDDETRCGLGNAAAALRDAEYELDRAVRLVTGKPQRDRWTCPRCRGESFYVMNFSHEISAVRKDKPTEYISRNLVLEAYNCESCDYVEFYRSPRDASIRGEGTRVTPRVAEHPYR